MWYIMAVEGLCLALTQGNKEIIGELNLSRRGRIHLCDKPFSVTREWGYFLSTVIFQEHKSLYLSGLLFSIK